MKDVLIWLDRIAKVMNVWLLMIAIGLFVIVLLFGITRLAPPAPATQTWSVQ